MSSILRVVEELVKHLQVVRVLSRDIVLCIFVVRAHGFLPKGILVVLGHFVQNFLKAGQSIGDILLLPKQTRCIFQLISEFLERKARDPRSLWQATQC